MSRFKQLIISGLRFRTLTRVFLASILVIQSSSLSQVQSAFDDLGVGARATGMANNHVAVADDVNTLWYNPAGLPLLRESEISTEYGQILRGLDDGSNLGTTYLGFAHPTLPGEKAFGAAYHNFKADNLLTERTLVLSYGQKLSIEPFGWKGPWYGGVNFKQLYHQFQPDRFTENALNDTGTGSGRSDPLFSSGYAKAAYAFDLSALHPFGPGLRYTAGLMLANVNRPNVSLSGGEDPVPFITKVGLVYRPQWGLVSSEVHKTKRLSSSSDTDLSLGIERFIKTGPLGMLLLRGGYADGSRGFKEITAGLGYAYNRFRFDYAFNLPINNTSDSNGSHHLGFSFKIGDSNKRSSSKSGNTIPLLSAFESESLTYYTLTQIYAEDVRLTQNDRDLLLLLLLRKYPLDDSGLKEAREDLKNLLRNKSNEELDWAHVKTEFLKNLNEEDKEQAGQSLELMIRGDIRSSLNRLALVSQPAQRGKLLKSLPVLAWGSLSASAYRANNWDGAMEAMRHLVDIMPSNKAISRAYHQLLSLKPKPVENKTEESHVEEDTTTPEELPEAPQTLVAPSNPETTGKEKLMAEKDAMARIFASSLGYYFQRKTDGAGPEERVFLLNQMKALFGSAGMDMSLVNKELSSFLKPEPTKTMEPAATTPEIKKTSPSQPTQPKKAPVTPAKKATKPTISEPSSSVDPAWTREWDYYRKAASRDISDHEKIEILEGMLLKFGERGAPQINKELQRIRKRIE